MVAAVGASHRCRRPMAIYARPMESAALATRICAEVPIHLLRDASLSGELAMR